MDDGSSSVPDRLERAALMKHAHSRVSYGSNSRASNTEDNSSDEPGRHDDEESLINSASHVVLSSRTASAPLSTKAILWMVLPLVLGWFLMSITFAAAI